MFATARLGQSRATTSSVKTGIWKNTKTGNLVIVMYGYNGSYRDSIPKDNLLKINSLIVSMQNDLSTIQKSKRCYKIENIGFSGEIIQIQLSFIQNIMNLN